MYKTFVLAPDSFKGTMSAETVCKEISRAIRKHIPDAEIRLSPVADGGEGLTETLLSLNPGERVTVSVTGALGEPVEAMYALMEGGYAVIEMAACAGLPLVGDDKRPLDATTLGVGEMLLDAKRRGVKRVMLGLGGSATNDCGIGMASALGFTFYDENGDMVEPFARNMTRIHSIKPPETPIGMEVFAACDVDNPLCGENGATYTFGMQKGASGEVLEALDAGLSCVADAIKRSLGRDVKNVPGAGAAGGLGAAVLGFLSGELKRGIDIVLDAANFDELLYGADIVITGEGRMDWQSARGKAPAGVANRARAHGIPCIALVGSTGKDAAALYDEGMTAIFTAASGAKDFEEIKRTCREDMFNLADAVVRMLVM